MTWPKTKVLWFAADASGYGDSAGVRHRRAQVVALIRSNLRLAGPDYSYRYLWRMERVAEIKPAKKGRTK